MKCKRCNGTGEEARPSHLQAMRIDSGLSQKQMAKKMAISASFMCDLENGKRTWTAKLLTRFNKALDVH